MLAEIRVKLESISGYLAQLRGYFDVDAKRQRIEALSAKMREAGFWSDEAAANAVVKELKSLRTTVEPLDTAFKKYKELRELSEIVEEEEKEFIAELQGSVNSLLGDVEKLQFKALFSGEFDKNNAIVSINAGAGGTESCDWASMLLRMYTRWAETRGYQSKTIDILPGEEAGVKNVTLLIAGDFAYGNLKSEKGVHRLVRISPFDANKRRHTSFASVDVIPEIEEDAGVALADKDLAIDTYRASGPGGQHMQKSDTAVRITHIPSGIVAQCQNERSQYQNKQTALKILKARLYEFEREKKEQELAKHYGGDKKKIEWGSQIRSYVMHPYTLVKDHRSALETGNVNSVMDGNIDGFIEAYLKMQAKAR
ncbi:MAG: peptide chain release factor 2 [Candidatus Omnitrophota bacterium]